ncbi:hypothetical protein AA14337_1551 [Acetobacter malorum DSM 14337]|uniref:Restriction endonuclease type I HsdR N-terminal domain-containing protein n=1 Tax=Acetobacter malorum DSM 14337 TaxID=1307910 RepID=A0ABQ0PSK8_9PROT|nr:type I restriction endonuclease [Acetobacter malorum]KXV09427.1 hypothetical protein AD930_02725 [Acetobacter malorum]GBQ79831.1 hypothetical protein AA14337_1551 [Acetobacter malorum DSM 14337]
MRGKAAKSQTESDLESGITAAISTAFPRLRSADIKHQIEFTIRLGHAEITANGRESWIRRGRADILLTHLDKPLAILELKRPALPLQADDDDQGISYARLLPTMAPFVVVTNGKSTRIIETFSGKTWTPETPDQRAFEALITAATKVAAADRHAAIATLMGSDPQVWTSAVITASQGAIAELTATADCPLRPFGPLKVPRLAAREAVSKFAAEGRLVLVSGPPLSGKTNVLEQVVRMLNPQVAGGLFLECAAHDVFQMIADLLADALDWPVNPEAARNWVSSISQSNSPLLVLAIDKLDPENGEDVRMIEDLTSSTFGAGLRVIVGLDEGVMGQVLRSPDGRRESPIGRRAEVVEVSDFAELEFRWAVKTLAVLSMGIMHGGQHSPDLRRPWLLQAMAARLSGIKREEFGVLPSVPGLEVLAQARAHFDDPELRRRYGALARAMAADAQDQSKPDGMALQLTNHFFVRRATMEAMLQSTDVDWLLRQGYLTPSIGEENTPIVTVAFPELLASELSRHLAVELRAIVDNDPKLAAKWLVGAASNFVLGDVIAAQTVLDFVAGNEHVPWTFLDTLLEMRPKREVVKVGQVLMGWVEGLGSYKIRPQKDGTAILTVDGEDHLVEEAGHESGIYDNIHGWLILAQLASCQLVVECDGSPVRLDPQILLKVGTADFVLRQPRNDLLMDGLPTHNTEDGGQFVCHMAGITEGITQSMLKYLSTECCEDKEAFINAAMKLDSIHLTARLGIALRMLASSANVETASWAEDTVALSRRATSSRLSTTGRLRGCATRTNLRARSGRSSVWVKKNRSADTMAFMVGVGMPAAFCAIWNWRTSSTVAV